MLTHCEARTPPAAGELRRADRRQLRSLDRHLARAWERDRAGRDAEILACLRARVGAPVASLEPVRLAGAAGLRVGWSDGLVVVLGPCHPYAVDRLSAGRPVALTRAARAGDLWVLDFAAGAAHVPLLAGAAAAGAGGGGVGPLAGSHPLVAA